ncbi:hypothetical protein CRUP_015666, partial [Coryphaenoides rupestris]
SKHTLFCCVLHRSRTCLPPGLLTVAVALIVIEIWSYSGSMR